MKSSEVSSINPQVLNASVTNSHLLNYSENYNVIHTLLLHSSSTLDAAGIFKITD